MVTRLCMMMLMLMIISCDGANKITKQKKQLKLRSTGDVGESNDEIVNIYKYKDENNEWVYENQEQHEASCNKRIPTLCDNKHHGLLAAKIKGLFTRYYEQIKTKNDHIISYTLVEFVSGNDIDSLLQPLTLARDDLISLGNKCGGLNHFVDPPEKQRCGFCDEGCESLKMTEEWYDAALKKVISAGSQMRNYIDGFEAGADAWIETLEETRDTSFEVTRACAVAIAVPMAVSALPATAGIGTSLVVGTGAGAITSGTVTAGTEGLKQGLDIAHGLQGEFDWLQYADAIGKSMEKGAVGGAAGVIMSLGSGAMQQLVDKIASKMLPHVSGVTLGAIKTVLASKEVKACIRQLVISSYEMMTNPKYSGRDMFEDMALALLTGGLTQKFNMPRDWKVNNIAVTDKLLSVVKDKLPDPIR